MQEIHITDSVSTKEPMLKGTEKPSTREFRQEELIAFYHASFPGMQPTPATQEAIRSLQLFLDSYISAEDPEQTLLLYGRAIAMILGMQSTLERELGIGGKEINRAVSQLWKNGLKNYKIK